MSVSTVTVQRMRYGGCQDTGCKPPTGRASSGLRLVIIFVFLLNGLPVGSYSVAASLEGSGEAGFSGIYLAVGRPDHVV